MSRNKPFYSEYVKHMMRFYSRSLDMTTFKSKVDELNWLICHDTLEQYPKYKYILIDVYAGYGLLDEEVEKASIKYYVEKKVIWDVMKQFERDLALNRGLL